MFSRTQASNDVSTMSLAVYVAFVNWGGLRRLCAIQNYWSGSDDWVNTGDMMEQHIVAAHLPGLQSQLAPLEKLVADELVTDKEDSHERLAGSLASSWLASACAALGQGSAAAALGRVGVLIEAAERELPKAMDRLYVETERELEIEDWELMPRSFAMEGAGRAELSPEWAAAASTKTQECNAGARTEISSEDSSDGARHDNSVFKTSRFRDSFQRIALQLELWNCTISSVMGLTRSLVPQRKHTLSI